MAYPYQFYQPQPQPQIFPQSGAAPDMLNQYKMPYQQQIPQIAQVQVPQEPMLWVLGEVEATGYPVAPNSTVVLWDRDCETIYIKSANAQGVPSMRILDYSERSSEKNVKEKPHECTCGKNFVKKKDFEAMQAEFEKMREDIERLQSRKVDENGK